VTLRRALVLPRDHGAHPAQAIEWWYLTGWLTPAGGSTPAWGFQLTFFRTPGPAPTDNTSRFAAHQVVMAHAALTELAVAGTSARSPQPFTGRLVHDQRIARTGLGLASVGEPDTALLLLGAGRPWRLVRSEHNGLSHYHADFDLPGGTAPGGTAQGGGRTTLTLDLTAPRTPVLQGDAGWSRKGPGPGQASLYLSEPQLALRGELVRRGQAVAVTGRAWLDMSGATTCCRPKRRAGTGWASICSTVRR
jgi:predicted secreted hydrolase